jgi:uncharacterized membrane-anchored protein
MRSLGQKPILTGNIIAGALGTIAGDYVSGDLGLGVGLASVVLSTALVACFMLRSFLRLTDAWAYWTVVVMVRSAGTTVGDYLTGRHGLSLGLPVSTELTGLLFVGLILTWRGNDRAAALP